MRDSTGISPEFAATTSLRSIRSTPSISSHAVTNWCERDDSYADPPSREEKRVPRRAGPSARGQSPSALTGAEIVAHREGLARFAAAGAVIVPNVTVDASQSISPTSKTVTALLATPWVPFATVVGWFTWAYLRLRPAAIVTSSAHAGRSYGPWAWGHLAYSDLISLYYAHHLFNHALPYVRVRIEYPVLTGVYMWLASWAPGVQGYFLVSSLGLLACALGTLHLLYRIDRRLGWTFALCPLLLVYGLLNWDLFAIFLMVAGWSRFRAQRYTSAGVLLSLAVWAKFFPIILLVYCIISLLHDPHDRDHAWRMTRWAGGTALVVNVPFAAANPANWAHFYVFNLRRSGRGGIFYFLHFASALSTPVVDLLSGGLVVLVAILLVPRVLNGDSPMAATAVVFAALMLVNKVFSPQYMLWLVVVGVVALWPTWSLATMSAAGILNYVVAMVILYLLHTRSPSFAWFFHVVNPWNVALRYGSITLGLFAALILRRDRPWSPTVPASLKPHDERGRAVRVEESPTG